MVLVGSTEVDVALTTEGTGAGVGASSGLPHLATRPRATAMMAMIVRMTLRSRLLVCVPIAVLLPR